MGVGVVVNAARSRVSHRCEAFLVVVVVCLFDWVRRVSVVLWWGVLGVPGERHVLFGRACGNSCMFCAAASCLFMFAVVWASKGSQLESVRRRWFRGCAGAMGL